jgi:Holliday junction resolvase RusA-like endonuclease
MKPMTLGAPFFAGVSGLDPTPGEHWLEIPGPPVPWAAKQTNPKTGNRFIASRQVEATGRVIKAVEDVLAAGGERFLVGEPLAISVVFFCKRPKGHYGSGRNSRTIKPQFVDAEPTGKPDLSNLLKLVEDGMVLGGLMPDDDQVVRLLEPLEKVYTTEPEEQPRTVVRIVSVTR